MREKRYQGPAQQCLAYAEVGVGAVPSGGRRHTCSPNPFGQVIRIRASDRTGREMINCGEKKGEMKKHSKHAWG